MIQRINLIEKQAFSFTYQKLLQICMVVIAINMLIISSQFLRVYRLKPQINFANIQLEQLNAENSDLTSQPVKKKVVSIGEYQQLFDTLQSVPNWSALMRTISANLPNSVWISAFKSLGAIIPIQNNAIKGEDKEEDKNPVPVVPQKSRIELSGVGADIKAIAEFVSKLEKTPQFSGLTLLNTSKDPKGFIFTLQGDVVLEYAR